MSLRNAAIAVGLLFAVLLPLGIEDRFWMNLFILAGIFIPLALGMTLLFGYTNLVSFGHGGFFAVGAYTSALLTVKAGWSVWLAMAAAIVAAAIVGYVVARPILRLKGLSLAMATLAFGQMVFILVQQLSVTGGPIGLSGIPAPELGGIDFGELRNYYWLVLAVAVVAFLATRNIAISALGRAYRALGASDPAARALGLHTGGLKAQAFTYSAALAGLAGALYAHYFSFISSDTFGLDLSIMAVIMVVVGGRYNLWGAVVGAIVITFLREYLRSYEEYSELVYGLLLILVFMAAPDGIVGIAGRIRRWLGRGRRTTPAPATVEDAR